MRISGHGCFFWTQDKSILNIFIFYIEYIYIYSILNIFIFYSEMTSTIFSAFIWWQEVAIENFVPTWSGINFSKVLDLNFYGLFKRETLFRNGFFMYLGLFLHLSSLFQIFFRKSLLILLNFRRAIYDQQIFNETKVNPNAWISHLWKLYHRKSSKNFFRIHFSRKAYKNLDYNCWFLQIKILKFMVF